MAASTGRPSPPSARAPLHRARPTRGPSRPTRGPSRPTHAGLDSFEPLNSHIPLLSILSPYSSPIKDEKKDVSTAILERKKAPNRLIVDEATNDDNSVVALRYEMKGLGLRECGRARRREREAAGAANRKETHSLLSFSPLHTPAQHEDHGDPAAVPGRHGPAQGKGVWRWRRAGNACAVPRVRRALN